MENINIFLRIDINIIAIIMLSLVYLLAFRRLEKKDTLNMLFNKVSILILWQLIIETLTCIINKQPQLWLIPLAYILHILLFALSPTLTCYWYFLIRRIIFPNDARYRKHHFLFILPVIYNAIVSILSPVYHFIFYIDSSNVYHRGNHFYIVILISYFYLFYGLVLIVINRKKLPKQDFNLLIIFNLLPVCGGVTQAIIYGPLLIWSSAAFSLVLAFISLQKRIVHLDDLTGAWDRGSFEFYIYKKLQYQQKKFGLIYVDIDKLKAINDNFGHQEGDEAIKKAVELIWKNLNKKEDIIVRMGGDEFLIILECETLDKLKEVIDKIKSTFSQYNLTTSKNYQLGCSLGCGIYDPEENISIKEFIAHIDNLMYEHKNQKKARYQN